MLEPVENTNYAYTACEYIYENFKKEIVENDNEDIRSLFLNNAPYEQGVVYLQVTKNNELICSSTAEGMGSDERDDLRIAITRALESLFNNTK